MRKALALIAAIVAAAVVVGNTGAATEGTTLTCWFNSASVGGGKTQCNRETLTFWRMEQQCNANDGIVYEYPRYLRAFTDSLYAGNATAGDPEYDGVRVVYHALKPHAKLLWSEDWWGDDLHDLAAGTPIGTC